MKKIKLSLKEKAIKKVLVKGEYRAASQAEFQNIASAIARRKKDAVLNIRVNRQDLECLWESPISHLSRSSSIISPLKF